MDQIDDASKTYVSPGKLLLSGEYVVLHGAKALALPTKLGQRTIIESWGKPGQIHWTTGDPKGTWFEGEFNLLQGEIIQTNHHASATFVLNLLMAIYAKKKALFEHHGFIFRHEQDFIHTWGLGSSSSLITNLARWASLDPMELHFAVSRGSGYDVACANTNHPIIYTLFKENMYSILPVNFNPAFHSHLYFVYLGTKQDSAKSVNVFLNTQKPGNKTINFFSNITQKFLQVNNLEEFIVLLSEHEKQMSRLLNLSPVKNRLFHEFNGAIKSLGAWGGDFVLLATSEPENYVKAFLGEKKIGIWFRYQDLILTSKS